MSDSGELDFSGLDGMDDIDWSDVESELQQNREMLRQELEESKEGSTEEAPSEVVPAEPTPVVREDMEMDFLMEIPLQLTVEVGRTRMKIKELLDLTMGSVVELKKKIGTPMHVLINDKLVAKGEIIIQNEKFGLKITEIADQEERLKKLKLS
ncbi:MAG: flagellar motor switch protein FliN [SAR324 cluster bacterium]|uniref:Flagellar motor switch protein FliN n=1 Tax=SAR324 cluster bacterium TaxID=2024889 RepID=A0A2A4SNL1_9DELT|nr:MAG: flagellar motor switch protein FliN [SAR324 cluster bacterium]